MRHGGVPRRGSSPRFVRLTFQSLDVHRQLRAFRVHHALRVAFVLEHFPVVQVNLLNASQAAMCAIGGVLVYSEPLTLPLVGGTLLTIVGLSLMSRRSKPRVIALPQRQTGIPPAGRP